MHDDDIISILLFRYSSCLHFLSHASHAMSDIMLHLSRPPPRQLRARPFVIQSVLQSAVIQSVPVTVGPSPPPASAPAASQPASGPNISTSSVATGPNTRQTTTTFSVSGNSADPDFERQQAEALRAARAQHEAQHAAAHTEAVRQAEAAPTENRRQPITDPFQQIEAILTAHQEMGPDDDFAQVVRNAIGDRDAARDDPQPEAATAPPPPMAPMPGAGPGVTAHMQPVVVGIELGPDQQAGPGMHGIISSAIQQALRGAGAMPPPASVTGSNTNNTTTTSSSSTATQGPQVQVAVGPTMSLPLGPPPPPGMGVGNLNSFDPFLPCSSRHLPSTGAQPRSVANTRRQTTRTVRSAPGSRASSMPRLISTPPRAGARADMLRAMMGGDQGPGATSDTDQGVLNMIQGVMGQVMGAMGGSQPGAQPTTIRQFLNTLPDYTYTEGESLITDLLMTLAGQLTFQDMVSIVTRNPSPETIGNLQEPLRRFIREKVLNGAEPSEENVKAALLRIADDWFEQMVGILLDTTELLNIRHF